MNSLKIRERMKEHMRFMLSILDDISFTLTETILTNV